MAEISYRQQVQNLTPRQLAFQQGLQQLTQGLAGADEGLRQQQATERQLAFQLAQDKANKLYNQGYNVSAQDIYNPLAEQNKPSGLMALFQNAPSQPQFDQNNLQYRQDYLAKLEADKQKQEMINQDRLANQQFRQQQLNLQRQNLLANQQLRKDQIDYKNFQEAEKKRIAGLPETRMEKLSAESKSKVGGIASGLDAINKIKTALTQGYRPEYLDANTPLIGGIMSDTPLTENQRILTEVVGRLQSGGAINSDEEKRFMAMSPRPGDSLQTQQRKLDNQRKFLENKLTAFGLKANELNQVGFQVSEAPQGGMFEPKNNSSLINQNAYASDLEILGSPERSQARQDRINFLLKKAGQ